VPVNKPSPLLQLENIYETASVGIVVGQVVLL